MSTAPQVDADNYFGFRVGPSPHHDEIPRCAAGCQMFSDGWKHHRDCEFFAWVREQASAALQANAAEIENLRNLNTKKLALLEAAHRDLVLLKDRLNVETHELNAVVERKNAELKELMGQLAHTAAELRQTIHMKGC